MAEPKSTESKPVHILYGDFQISIHDLENKTLKIEALHLPSSTIFSRSLSQEDKATIDPQDIYPELKDLSTALGQGFGNSRNYQASIALDGIITLKTEGFVGTKKKDFVVAIELKLENQSNAEFCEKLLLTLNQKKTQTTEEKETKMYKILELMIQNQKETDAKLEQLTLKFENNDGKKNDDVFERFETLSKSILDMIHKQETSIQQNREKVDEVGKAQKALEKSIHTINSQLLVLEKKNDGTPKSDKNISEFVEVRKKIEEIERNLSNELTSQTAKIETAINAENDIQKQLEVIKGQLKVFSGIMDSNFQKNKEHQENVNKMIETYKKDLEVQVKAVEGVKDGLENRNAVVETKLVEIEARQRKENLRLSTELNELSSLVSNTLINQDSGEIEKRLKALEDPRQMIEIPNHSGHKRVELHPQFDVTDIPFIQSFDGNKEINTVDGVCFGKAIFAKAKLPDQGVFYFSIECNKVTCKEGGQGLFAVGVSGKRLAQTQMLLAPGCYFINPLSKCIYYTGDFAEYQSDFKMGDIIAVLVDRGKSTIIFKLNGVSIFEGALDLDTLEDEIFPCVYMNECSNINLKFV